MADVHAALERVGCAAVTIAALLALHRYRSGLRHAMPPLAAMAVAPLGLAGYLGWVGYRTGDSAGYFKLEDGGWGHKFDFGRQTLHVLTSAPTGHFDYLYAYSYEDIIGIGAVLLALILIPLLIRLRPPPVLVAYAVLTVALTLGSQQIFGNVSRYLLPLPPSHPARHRHAQPQPTPAVHAARHRRGGLRLVRRLRPVRTRRALANPQARGSRGARCR